MNKYLLLALIALSGCMKLSAQEYKYVPLVREGIEWCYFVDGQVATADYDHFSLYKIEEDTLIAGTTYKKCNSYNRGKKGKVFREGYFREENKKVYFLNEENKNYGKDGECLLYDFSLTQVGDTLIWDEVNEFNRWLVTKIDTLTIGGSLRKRFWFDQSLDGSALHSYTEGIGATFYEDEIGLWFCVNLMNLFECYITSISAVYNNIVYVKRSTDGVFEYLNEDYYNDFLVSSIESVSSTALQISQEPGRWIVTFPPNEEYSKVEVLDAAGRIVHSESISGKAETLTIPTNKFAQGIYIVVLTAQSGKLTTCKMQVR